jgi:hypothetical protein
MRRLTHERIQLKNRQQNCEHDDEHDRAHGQNQHRFEQRNERGNAAFQFLRLLRGRALEHLVEGACCFAARDHVHHERRKHLGARVGFSIKTSLPIYLS